MRLAGRSWHPLPAALALALSLSLGGGMAAHAGQDADTPGSAAGIGAEAVEDDAAGIVGRLAHAVDSCPSGWEGRIPAEPGETPTHRPSAKNEAGETRVSTMTWESCDPADLADF